MPVTPAIVILSEAALPLANRVAALTGGTVHGLAARCPAAAIRFEQAGAHLRALFQSGTPIVALMASGALIRILAPLLADKTTEPPVLALAEDGSSAVPLLGGHHGANALARMIADGLSGHAAVTTAGDLKFGLALDASPVGWVLENVAEAKAVMADLVAGARVTGAGEGFGAAGWLTEAALPWADSAGHAGAQSIDIDGASIRTAVKPASTVTISVTNQARAANPGELLYRPRNLVLGLGCERGAEPAELIALATSVFAEAGVSPLALAAVASIDLKADETAIHAVADHFDVPSRFFDAAVLETEAERLEHPSNIVFHETGCHGVCEGAALAAVGRTGRLRVAKRKSKRATAALGEAPAPVDPASFGRARGTLFVVGIGPGGEAWRSPEVTRMIGASSDLVGYSLYLDLLGDLCEGKTRHDFDLGREEARVRHAMELAGTGRNVALVCSGDAGIYAMATLVFELLDKAPEMKGAPDMEGTGASGRDLTDAAKRISIACSPGISALQGAAARAGAPLGHDFCTISLSDLLTPWDDIQRRVRAAGEADFVIAFYNPVSRKRRTQLAFARDELLHHRPADTPVILATNLGREGETVRFVALAALDVDDVDMLTVVIVGSSQTRLIATGDGRRWVYTPRGYAGKAGTGMSEAGVDKGEAA